MVWDWGSSRLSGSVTLAIMDPCAAGALIEGLATGSLLCLL